MSTGLARHALRRHRWSLLGTAGTQVIGALVLATMINTLSSINQSLSQVQHSSDAMMSATEFMGIFLGNAVYFTMLVVGVTMTLAAKAQLHDLALMRTIGASPGQVRRSLRAQAVLVGLPAALIGAGLAVPVGWIWLEVLMRHHVVADTVRYSIDARSFLAAVGVVGATSVVGTFVGVIRLSRRSPASALATEEIGRVAVGHIRTAIGLLLMAGGIVLSLILSSLAPKDAGDAAVFVLLAECVGVGLIGPLVLGWVCRWFMPLFPGGLATVASDDLRAMSRSLSGALVPVVLATAFATVKLGAHMSAPSGEELGANDATWADISGTAVFCAYGAVAGVHCLVTVMRDRRPRRATMSLAGASQTNLVSVAAIQAAVVTLTAAALSGVIAVATLAPTLHAQLDRWLPTVPVDAVAVEVVILAGVIGGSMVVPVVLGRRERPVRIAATRP